MNKGEYEKLSTYDEIDYDIQIELYKYNYIIATMNNHLGEMYGYSDVKKVEETAKEEELSLYKKALKEKCDAIDKAIEEIKKELKENNHLSYGIALSIIGILNNYEEILKGSD